MTLVWAILVVVAFALIVGGLGLPGRAGEVGARAAESVAVLKDPGLDDASKEKALRGLTLRLLVLLAVLVGGGILALALPLGAVWVAERAGAASFAAVLEMLGRLDFLVAVTVVGGAVALGLSRLRRP